jgi:FKBP-type peptidyl-prolyl cis-trans isomerase FkpA
MNMNIKISLLPIAFIFLFLFSGCTKDEVDQQAVDLEKIKIFLNNSGIEAQYNENGFYYVISLPGTDPKPTVNSTITVKYKGTLLTGATFDESNSLTFPLTDLIKGWQLGIPLIGTGGRIKLYLPSTLGYGNRNTGGIPANSILIFDVTLNSFSN